MSTLNSPSFRSTKRKPSLTPSPQKSNESAEVSVAISGAPTAISATKTAEDCHVVVLLAEGEPPEEVYRGSRKHCLYWVREWLREPLGITVAIVPPSSPTKPKGGAF